MKKRGRPKASKREDAVDFIGSMPDAILLLILSRLSTIEEQIQTSILSRRWRYLWTAIPSLYIDFPVDHARDNESHRHKFIEFAYWVLANKSVDLESFTICSHDSLSVATVWRWVHMAVTRNVKQLDLFFSPEKESKEYVIAIPQVLATCCSLEVLTLCTIEHGLRLPNFAGFPALRVLELNWVDLLEDEGLVKDFLETCPMLEDLTLEECILDGLDLLCISCPKLNKLKIKNVQNLDMCSNITIACPKLMCLELKGETADNLILESLDSLKEAVIDPEVSIIKPVFEPETEPLVISENFIRVLLPGISHVESLKIDFNLFYQCINSACDHGLPNLKTLVLTTKIAAFTFNELTQILKIYPKLESLKLIIKKKYKAWKERKLDEAEIRNILYPDLKRVEFFEFYGQKPILNFVRSSNVFEFIEMVFSWGNKANHSH